MLELFGTPLLPSRFQGSNCHCTGFSSVEPALREAAVVLVLEQVAALV